MTEEQKLLEKIPSVLNLREFNIETEKSWNGLLKTFYIYCDWTEIDAQRLKEYMQEEEYFERAVRECIKYLVVREGLKGYECNTSNTIYPPEGVDDDGEKFSLNGPALVKAPTPFAYIIREKLLPQPNWWARWKINYYGSSRRKYISTYCPKDYDPVEEILKKLLTQ